MSEQNSLTIEFIRENKYDIDSLDLTIKSYISLTEKKILIEKILDICIINEDMKRIDFALKQFAYEYMLVSLYTNIQIETEDIIEIYDELKQNGVINNIIKQIPESEIEFINYILEKEIEQILQLENNISSIVSKILNKLIDKLPNEKELSKLIKDLPKQINKVNPDKLKFISEVIGWNQKEK